MVFWIRLFFFFFFSLIQHIFEFILEKVCTPPTSEICVLDSGSSLPLNHIIPLRDFWCHECAMSLPRVIFLQLVVVLVNSLIEILLKPYAFYLY